MGEGIHKQGMKNIYKKTPAKLVKSQFASFTLFFTDSTIRSIVQHTNCIQPMLERFFDLTSILMSSWWIKLTLKHLLAFFI